VDPLATDVATRGGPGANLAQGPVVVTSEPSSGGGNSAVAPTIMRGSELVRAKLPWPDVSDLVPSLDL
jgi:hypothetical protein